MSMDPMSGGPGYAIDQTEGGSSDSGGACSVCGRALPPPDLEAVAASIDQTLSMEAGRMVPRTAWAGRAPDGGLDALLFWLPAVKARRQLWERGQALWTEQMTAVLSGPCAECHGAGMPSPEWTPDPPYTPAPAPDHAQSAPTSFLSPDEAAPAPPPAYAETLHEAPPPQQEAMTAAIPAYTEQAPPAEPYWEAETAVPAAGTANRSAPPSTPPVPDSDEHESRTMIFSALPSFRTTTRVVVLEGPVRGRQFSLGREKTTIGRSIGCHITVEADAVEYDHASIVREGSAWRVERAGTASELHVNDEPVSESRHLTSGDVIRVGPARLRFETVNQV